MCFRLKHFPAHHSDRTSLTPAIISEFKVHESAAGAPPHTPLGELTALPRHLAGLGGADKEGGELGKKGRERERERVGREGGERGKGRGGTRPSFERN